MCSCVGMCIVCVSVSVCVLRGPCVCAVQQGSEQRCDGKAVCGLEDLASTLAQEAGAPAAAAPYYPPAGALSLSLSLTPRSPFPFPPSHAWNATNTFPEAPERAAKEPPVLAWPFEASGPERNPALPDAFSRAKMAAAGSRRGRLYPLLKQHWRPVAQSLTVTSAYSYCCCYPSCLSSRTFQTC